MNKLMENWKVFWGQLGANQRVSLILTSIIIVVAMGGLLLWAQKPQMRLLYGSVNPKDAAGIIEHLDGAGIPYEMRAGGSAIFVPADQVYQARMDVVSQGLVKGDAVGFEIFDQSSFGVSDFIQRTNFVRAVQGELARTITQLDGVRSARVMVVMPDNRLLLLNRNVETTASVFVDVGGMQLADNAVKSIQSLVANAVEGLTTANVAVVDNQGNVLSKKPDDGSVLAGSGEMVEYRRGLENYFAHKVESMLERVVGAGNAVVRVAAEVSTAQVSQFREDFNEDAAALRSQSSTESSVTSSEGTQEATGMTDVATLQLDEGLPMETRNSSNEETLRDRKQEYEIDRTVTSTLEQPGVVKRITASVFVALREVPGEAEGEIVPQPRSAEEIERLRQMVANALGVALTGDAANAVVLEEVPFTVQDPLALLAQANSGFDIATLLQFSEEIFGGLVALILFMAFMALLRRGKAEPSVFAQLEESRRARVPTDPTAGQVVTPELLNELIRQKPENAGTTLRNWLSGKPAE